jgi:hypothetical protein
MFSLDKVCPFFNQKIGKFKEFFSSVILTIFGIFEGEMASFSISEKVEKEAPDLTFVFNQIFGLRMRWTATDVIIFPIRKEVT